MLSAITLLSIFICLAGCTATAAEIPPCKYDEFGQVDASITPCKCGDEETVCQANEMCGMTPSDEAFEDGTITEDFDPSQIDAATLEGLFAEGALMCYAAPCDDLSGQWVWHGRNPQPWIPGDFSVWATVNIEQENCQFVLSSTSNVGSDGQVLDSVETRDYYGVFQLNELTTFNLFDTEEERDAYLSNPLDYLCYSGEGYNQRYIFTQNFGNGGPAIQCSLSGSLVYKGFGSDLPDDVDSYSGSLTRDVDGTYSIGDIIAADSDFVAWEGGGGCPDGYPRPWTADGDNVAETSASPSSSTPTHRPSTINDNSITSSPASVPATDETSVSPSSEPTATPTIINTAFPLMYAANLVNLCGLVMAIMSIFFL